MGILLPVVIGLAVGITMVVSFAVLMPSLPSLQNKPAERVWMALDIGQCAFPWESFMKTGSTRDDAMKQYFHAEHDLAIYEVSGIKSPKFNDPTFTGYIPCEACGCYGGTVEALIDLDEMDK